MYAVDQHDFYTNEMKYLGNKDEVFPRDVIHTYKLADAIERLLAITAVPQDFEPARLDDRIAKIRLWIAQAYAFGHVFMVPTKMWSIRITNEADHWYHSKVGDYEDLYHFVRDYSQLFDGYEAVAKVALIFSNGVSRKYSKEQFQRSAPATAIVDATAALTHANIPHRYIVAGDDWIKDSLLSEDLTNLDAVVCFDKEYLNDAQTRKLDEIGTKLITWTNAEQLLSTITPSISVHGADNIVVQARENKDDASAPLILHLVNFNLDHDDDAFTVQNDVDIALGRSLTGRAFTSARFYAPGVEPVALQINSQGEETVIRVPHLSMWGILTLA
ncbi:hypothetical protein PSQ90_10800 [Devosia rhodophyticola]|uniref:Uncharacterized protein n=1 Tax=Devosia rhodophyticola TaxID=3026423 RepID=A0ABY7YU69_9HYPH|nr:hypothetical protein [Devosia rhodophyticola]WDR04801.1 hypothetical protein PSQ90_10800 [Devosia rhodophyticola]